MINRKAWSFLKEMNHIEGDEKKTEIIFTQKNNLNDHILVFIYVISCIV